VNAQTVIHVTVMQRKAGLQTLQAVTLPSGASAILSDTVGFINDLPVQLLDAFKVS
jgi:50S ribosomal subunit-associated GTPase HflX